MAIKFEITQTVHDYVKVGDHYDYVDAEIDYECNNYDDLQKLLLTLIDFGKDKLRFTVEKKAVEE